MQRLRCTCGETFQADDAHIGKAVRCRCGRILQIARPRPSGHHAPLTLAVSASIALFFFVWALTRTETPRPTSAVVARSADDPYQRAVEEAFDLLDSAGPVAPQAPPCPAEDVLRPPSSEELGGSYRGGLGRLRVMNGTDFDAVAVLLESSTNLPRRAIYIRRNESGSIIQIPPGAYWLQFQLGTSWHVNRHFCRMAGSFEFDDPFDFEEREKSDAIEYSTFKITLHPVPLGTATTHSIPASAFQLPPL